MAYVATTKDEKAEKLLARTERMKGARSNFDAMWQEVRDQIIPMLQRFIGTDPKGVKSNLETLDETPEQAHELLAAALHGMMTNPALKWFDLGPQRKELMSIDRVAVWCALARERAFDYMYAPTANLTASLHESYMDICAFGTAGLFTGDRPGKGLLFQARQLRELYLAENEEGRVDTVHRWFHMTARQAVQKFEKLEGAYLPQVIRDKANSPTEQDRELPFLHAVYPRTDRAYGKIGGKNLPIASTYVSVEGKCVIREHGYQEMPYAVPRWMKRAGEIYGRGPGTKALASCKALQRAMRITFRGAEKAIEPPLQVADDGVSGPVKLHSGGLTYVRAELLANGRDAIKPILTGARPDLGDEFMEKIRNRIQASFYNHLLQMMRDPRMTATQVIQIAEETLRILGPVIGRLQAELLGPLIERVIGLLIRAGALPDMPPELYGQEMVIEYVSPIAQAQKLAEAKGIVQTFGVALQMSQVDPGIMHNMDLDGALRALAVMFGMPRQYLRDPRKVLELRAADKKAQQVNDTIAQLRQAAGGVKDAASALPNIREGLGFTPDQGQGSAPALAA